MNHQSIRYGFAGGIAVAFICALSASIGSDLLEHYVYRDDLLMIITAGVTLIYLIYVFHSSKVISGRLTALMLWLVGTAISVFTFLPFEPYLLSNLLFLWIVRSVFFQANIIGAIIHMGLIGLGFTVALWTALHTESHFLTVWSFFLIQALIVFIPELNKSANSKHWVSTTSSSLRFETAKSRAQAAIRQLGCQ